MTGYRRGLLVRHPTPPAVNAEWVAAVRSIVALRKADGWMRTVHGRGWTRQHIYNLGSLRVELTDTYGITVAERSGPLRADWSPRMYVNPMSVQQATNHLVAQDILPEYMSSGYGIGAVEAIGAAKEAMVQGLVPRLADAIREEISAVKV